MWWTRKDSDEIADRNQKFYVSSKWRKLRLYVLCQQPLCPNCLLENKYEPSAEVHHVHNISTDVDGWRLRLSMIDDHDKPNLIGLCSEHHGRVSAMERRLKAGETVVSTYDRMNDLNDF
jgi:5-methylcytosine-specific restriction endonuclease McrA